MLLKRLKIAKLCGYFVIIVAPLPLWHTAKLPLGFPSQRKNKTSVKVSNADVPRHLLKRPVSWLCSPQSGKHFHRGPCWHSSTGVCCGCCWARDALSLSLALNPMRWAFFEPPARDLTPVWPPMSGGLDLGCFMFPRVLFVQQGDAKLGEVLIYIIFATKAAGMCARAKKHASWLEWS